MEETVTIVFWCSDGCRSLAQSEFSCFDKHNFISHEAAVVQACQWTIATFILSLISKVLVKAGFGHFPIGRLSILYCHVGSHDVMMCYIESYSQYVF